MILSLVDTVQAHAGDYWSYGWHSSGLTFSLLY